MKACFCYFLKVIFLPWALLITSSLWNFLVCLAWVFDLFLSFRINSYMLVLFFIFISSMFRLNSYTWSFLLDFEVIFVLNPSGWILFWIQIIDLNSTHPMFLELPLLSFQTMFLSVASFVILWSSLCLLLLYKRLPSKATLLTSFLNVYFIG